MVEIQEIAGLVFRLTGVFLTVGVLIVWPALRNPWARLTNARNFKQ